MAEVSGLSVRQFSRAFPVNYGIAPYEWVLRRRAEVARDLLAEGHKARDVAAMWGFFSRGHMTRRFRVAFGYTPSKLE